MPQERGEVPTDLVAPLERVGQILRAADLARDELVITALRAGASTHEIAKRLDVTQATVWRMGKRLGWPDADEIARRDAEREKRRSLLNTDLVDAIMRGEVSVEDLRDR